MVLITCYKIELIIEKKDKGKIKNKRMGASFLCVLLLIRRDIFIDTTW